MRLLILITLGFITSLNTTAGEPSVNEPAIDKNLSQKLDTKENTGETIYQQYCYVCHQSGTAGAPRFEQQEDWAARLKDKSLEKLTESAMAGLNMMPVKGTCSECSEEDIRSAIEFMLPKS